MTWTGPKRQPRRSPIRTSGRGRWPAWRRQRRAPVTWTGPGAGRAGRGGGPGNHRPGPAGAGAGRLAEAAAGAGDLDRAGRWPSGRGGAQAITDPGERAGRWLAWRRRRRAPVTWTGPGAAEQAEAAAQAITDPTSGRGRWPGWWRRRRVPVTWTGPERWPSRPRRRPGRSPARTGGRGRWLGWWRRRRVPVTWTGPGAGRAGRGDGPGDHQPGRAGAGAGQAGEGRSHAGDLDRAEVAAQAIIEPYQRARALVGLVEAAAAPVTWTGPGRWPSKPRRRPGRSPIWTGKHKCWPGWWWRRRRR